MTVLQGNLLVIGFLLLFVLLLVLNVFSLPKEVRAKSRTLASVRSRLRRKNRKP